MARWLRVALLLLLSPGIVGCDHGTKHLAEQWLTGRRMVDVIPGVLDLRLTPNHDTAFSLLGSHLADPARRILILALVGAIILGTLVLAARRWQQASTLERVAFLTLLGGAFGNFWERLLRGYVVDFIHLAYWPVFNVADLAICVGAGLLLLASRRKVLSSSA
jgi:signal peptidase II